MRKILSETRKLSHPAPLPPLPTHPLVPRKKLTKNLTVSSDSENKSLLYHHALVL